MVDLINLTMGVLLFTSPWLFGFSSAFGWHTSWMAGAAITILAMFSIADLFEAVPMPEIFEEEEWIILTIGLWIAICPWILGFHGDVSASNVHFAIGLIIAGLAAVELWSLRHTPHSKV
ncbi:MULTISPECIES: SPW repeat protein [unclassified Bradyrhizobium]|uniref:SPW repeat protein n=1 Tax=unclassified Bradyrhizobium TaxID=2631580 RepID=UPI001E496856|nr:MULTISPECIES: SPW repeat protein [unclassified Bradyrhizobium]